MIRHVLAVILITLTATAACSRSPELVAPESPYKLSGPLVSSATNMMTAWYFPKNPLTDRSLDKSKLSQDIKWGFRLFTDTPHQAPQFAPSKMSCNNCHLNGGQRARALPLGGVAGMFPEENRRSGRLYSLKDRIVDFFVRSEKGTWGGRDGLASPTSPEILAPSPTI